MGGDKLFPAVLLWAIFAIQELESRTWYSRPTCRFMWKSWGCYPVESEFQWYYCRAEGYYLWLFLQHSVFSHCNLSLQFLTDYLARHNCKSLAIHIERLKRIILSTFTHLQVCFSINRLSRPSCITSWWWRLSLTWGSFVLLILSVERQLICLLTSRQVMEIKPAWLLEGVLFDILNLNFKS